MVRLRRLAAISGSDDGLRWVQTEDRGGTDLPTFYSFVEMILDDLGQGDAETYRVLTMDNLNVHHHLVIQQLIEHRGHRCMCPLLA